MAERPHNILICSCEDSMPLAGEAVRRVCKGANVLQGRQLCRAELDRFRKSAGTGEPIMVACTQEAPLFEETAGEIKDNGKITFVNIRETAGWSKDAKAAAPKMAALIAMAMEPAAVTDYVPLTSDGVTLVYGKDDKAIEAARLLRDHLDVTVLIKPPAAVTPPRATEFPVVKGNIRQAKGYLGAFELTVDDYAVPAASSRGELTFGTPRNGAISRCDIVLDLTGGALPAAGANMRVDRHVIAVGCNRASRTQIETAAAADDLAARMRAQILGKRNITRLVESAGEIAGLEHRAQQRLSLIHI